MKQIIYIFTLGLLFQCAANTSLAQYDTTWIKTYGGDKEDIGKDIILAHDSGFMVIGSTSSYGFDNSQMYFMKLDSIGQIQWSKSYGGPNQEWGQAVIQCSDKGFLGLGYSNSTGSGGYDLYLVKLDSNGNYEYEVTQGGADWDFGYDIIEVAPGQFVIAGETYSYGAGNSDGWLLKFIESSKTFQWQKTVGDNQADAFNAVTLGPNNKLFAVGYKTHPVSLNKDVFVSAFSPTGDTLWTKTYGDTLDDWGNDIVFFKDSNLVFTGASIINNSKKTYSLKIDTLGDIKWSEKWSFRAQAEGKSLIERPDGNAAILSHFQDDITADGFWYVFMGFNGSGVIDTNDHCFPEKILFDSYGNYMMFGYTYAYNSNFSDMVLFKTKYGMVNGNNFTKIKDNNVIISLKEIERSVFQVTNSNYGLEIEYSLNDPFQVKLFSLEGKELFFSDNNTHQKSISLCEFHSGAYLLILISQNYKHSELIFINSMPKAY